jgi:WhiB family transcriptional regulator, redox-sensing transcriptional regulator
VITGSSGRAGACGDGDTAAHRGAPAWPGIILPGGAVMPAWYAGAPCARADCACKDAFFPSDAQDAQRAREFCASCPFRTRCLAFAIEHDEQHGIWGGLDPRERRALRTGPSSSVLPGDAPGEGPAPRPPGVTPLAVPAAREGGTP